jgi:ribosomal protein L37AE/L43A
MSDAHLSTDTVNEPTCVCPGCHTVKDVRVLTAGWLFRCDACNWEYGHPQMMNRLDAHEELAAVRRSHD